MSELNYCSNENDKLIIIEIIDNIINTIEDNLEKEKENVKQNIVSSKDRKSNISKFKKSFSFKTKEKEVVPDKEYHLTSNIF